MTARAIRTGPGVEKLLGPGSNEVLRGGCAPQVTPLRVAVVDDDPALHAQVREQLQHSGAPWHMTSYHNGAEAMKGVVAAPPQVVLLDIGMPEMNGIECAHQLAQRIPALPVVMHTRRAQPEMVVSALRAGARGYVVKTAPLNGLVPLLNKAMTGGLALCANGERLLMEAMHRTFPAAPEWGLTQREEAVLFCLCRHLSDKEMASALAISEETVHVHLRHAFKKLGIHNRQAAIRVFTKKWSGGGGVNWPGAASAA